MKLSPSATSKVIIAAERILLVLWVGGLWIVGYMVAPMLFHILEDRRLAGEIAGRLFSVMNYIGLACGTALLLSVLYQAGQQWRRSWRAGALLAMLILISIGQFGLQPMMQALKMAVLGGFVQGSAEAARFGMLHGVSSMLFLITSLLGLVLVVCGFSRVKKAVASSE